MANLTELSYGTVNGRFLAGIADTDADPDVEPDVVPMTGYVTFSATAGAIRVTGANPDPVTVFPQNIRADLDEEGYISIDGVRDITLWATDDPDGNPVNWQWRVAFKLSYNGVDFTYPSFNFELPAGSTVDLTEVAPLLTPSAGQIITKGEKGDPGGAYTPASEAETLLGTANDKTVTPLSLASASKSTSAVAAGYWVRYGSGNELFVRLNPTNNYEAASKYYVDNRALENLTEAEFLAITDGTPYARIGKVTINDIAAFTGVSGFTAEGGTYPFESVVNWLGGPDIWGVWSQRLHVPHHITGEMTTLERVRLYTDGVDWDAWSIWRVAGAGLKTYLSTAEVDAVETSEQGIIRLDTGDLYTWIPNDSLQYFGGDVLVTSTLQDGYGTGFPPAAGGQMTQQAEVGDGYGSYLTLRRYRGYNSGTNTWNAWSGWVLIPIPQLRPNQDGVWKAGAASTGYDDAFLPLGSPISNGSSPNGSTDWEMLAERWTAWFVDPARWCMSGGEMKVKSASLEWDGILDTARSEIGTGGFAAREVNLPGQTGRYEIVANAAATDAIAGFSMPLGITTRYGLLLHATFAMKSGISSNTRLLLGLCHTADVALNMTDIDPAAMQNFVAFGYGNADAEVKGFSRAAASLNSSSPYLGSSVVAPSTSADQLIDLKIMQTPNATSACHYVLSVRKGTTVYRSYGVLTNPMLNSTALSLFLRASAGGTSATPRVALHRLRLGAGLGDVGGW